MSSYRRAKGLPYVRSLGPSVIDHPQSTVGDNGRQRRMLLPGGERIATPVPVPVRRFRVLLEWDAHDRVWVTFVPSLDLLSTYGNTREEALDNSREAILGYLEAAAKEGISLPSSEAETEVVELEVATP